MKKFILLVLFIILFNPTKVLADQSNCPLTAGFWVEKGMYNYFNPQKNPASHNTFEQWINRQMDEWNKILSKSGIRDCFKVGKIVKVDDGALPLNGGVPTNHPNRSDRDNDVVWGFPTSVLTKDKDSIDYWKNALNGVDRGLLHELSHARYLMDTYGLDVSATTNIPITDPQGRSIVGNYLKLNGDILYHNKSADFMSNHMMPDPFYSAWSAGALNRIAGQHFAQQYGNYNMPSNGAEYFNDLPAKNILRILDTDNQPLVNATVNIYQARTTGLYTRQFLKDPDITGVTDNNGNISIGHNPFGAPFTGANAMAHGIFILGVLYRGQAYYQFIEVSDFNLAYWKGATDQAIFGVKTNLKSSSDQIIEFSFSPSPVTVGDVLEIKGSGFGNTPGKISFLSVSSNSNNSLPEKDYEIESWSDSVIKIRIKESAERPFLQGRWKVKLVINKSILGINIGSQSLESKNEVIIQGKTSLITLTVNISLTCGINNSPLPDVKVSLTTILPSNKTSSTLVEAITNKDGKGTLTYTAPDDWNKASFTIVAPFIGAYQGEAKRISVTEKPAKPIEETYSFNYPACPQDIQPDIQPDTKNGITVNTISPNPAKINNQVTISGKGFGDQKGVINLTLAPSNKKVVVFIPENSGFQVDKWSDTSIKLSFSEYFGKLRIREGTTTEDWNINIATADNRSITPKQNLTLSYDMTTTKLPEITSVSPDLLHTGEILEVKGFGFGAGKGSIIFTDTRGGTQRSSEPGHGISIVDWSDTTIKVKASFSPQGNQYRIKVYPLNSSTPAQSQLITLCSTDSNLPECTASALPPTPTPTPAGNGSQIPVYCANDPDAPGCDQYRQPTPTPTAPPIGDSSSPGKTVIRVKINYQEVNLSDLNQAISVRLNGTQGQSQDFNIPIEITYSDGSSKYLALPVFYRPPAKEPQPPPSDGSSAPVCLPGCCGNGCGSCPNGQSCTISNGACSSGFSCDSNSGNKPPASDEPSVPPSAPPSAPQPPPSDDSSQPPQCPQKPTDDEKIKEKTAGKIWVPTTEGRGYFCGYGGKDACNASSQYDACIGVPWVCENGEWKESNPYGECTTICNDCFWP